MVTTSPKLRNRGLSGLSVPDLERDFLAFLFTGGGGQRTQGRCRASLPPDHPTELTWRNIELDERRATMQRLGHIHLLGMVGEGLGQDLDHPSDTTVLRHGRYSVATGAAAWAGASGVR